MLVLLIALGCGPSQQERDAAIALAVAELQREEDAVSKWCAALGVPVDSTLSAAPAECRSDRVTKVVAREAACARIAKVDSRPCDDVVAEWRALHTRY